MPAPAYAAYAPPYANPDEVRTVFVTGFPPDVKERELNNLLRFVHGCAPCMHHSALCVESCAAGLSYPHMMILHAQNGEISLSFCAWCAAVQAGATVLTFLVHVKVRKGEEETGVPDARRYEASQMHWKNGMAQGFALFAHGEAARAAIGAIHNLVFDDGVVCARSACAPPAFSARRRTLHASSVASPASLQHARSVRQGGNQQITCAQTVLLC